jgi:hypothetical protein
VFGQPYERVGRARGDLAMRRWVPGLLVALVIVALIGWMAIETVASSQAELREDRAREGAAYQRGRLAATCERYCADIDLQWGVLASPEVDRFEGHVVAVDGEEPRCRCMLADIPPRAADTEAAP